VQSVDGPHLDLVAGHERTGAEVHEHAADEVGRKKDWRGARNRRRM